MIPIPISADDFIKQFCAPFEPPQHAPDMPGGSVWHVEGRILAGLAARLGGPILEIGSLLGVSTRYLAEGLRQAGDSVVYAVDIAHQWSAEGWPNIQQFTQRSDQVYVPAAWAFIDGDHSYEAVLTDVDVAKRCFCTRMLFHDTRADGVNLNGARVRPAVLDRLGADPVWRLLDIDTPCGMIYADHGP